MYLKQISVFVENQQGKLAGITDALKDCNIDICAFSISDTPDYGILRLIVDDPQKTEDCLKNEGYTANITDVMGILLDDKPGALAGVIRLLADNSISISYLYPYIQKNQYSGLVLKLSDMQKGKEVLTQNGVKFM